MSLPHKLRYSLARLKPLTQPVVWCPLLALALLASFVLEQRNHPAWFGEFELGGSNPNRSDRNAFPTSEEQADIPDIDSLDALFNDLKIQPQAPLALGNSNQSTPESTSSTLLSLLQNSRPQPPGISSAGNPEAGAQASNPFESYQERYRFIGSTLSDEDGQTPFLPQNWQSNSANSSSHSLFPNNFSDSSPFDSGAQPPNQLSLALERRSLAGQQLLQDQRQTSAEEASEEALENDGTAALNLNGQQAIFEGNIPGSSLTFIRTIPDMSPPPGTTGYTPPATLNLSPATLSGGNAFTNLIAPQAASGLNGIPSSLTPGQSGGLAGNTGGIGVPGSVLPPTSGTQLQPQIEGISPPEPAPFSVPREPGRYVGGGYINTFSNPGAPPE